jgi:hypothetical protein
MRWYFAIDEGGAAGQIGTLARRAVLSARAVGGLEPVLLYYGARGDFTRWMEANGVRVVDTAPRFLDTLLAAQAAGKYQAHSIGHWLRLAIPQVEAERDYVLYTDCDILFHRRFDWDQLRPKIFSAAPEFSPENWNYFNSGVMVLNVAAMRATYQNFENHIKSRMLSGDFFSYDDQLALNEAYHGHWQRLDPICNWKPYWPYNPQAVVLHLHGPKPDNLEAIALDRWPLSNPTAIFFEKMLNAHSANYLAWSQHLSDSLQNVDFSAAVQFSKLASALLRYRRETPQRPDDGFMNLQMFAGLE